MNDTHLEETSLVKFAGLALGIVIGGPLGPLVFTPAGLSVPASATAGSFLGAVLGYAVTSVALAARRRRRDRELSRAAEAVKAEAGLPQSLHIRVKEGRLILTGEVEDLTIRREAEQVIATLPGIKGVDNRIRLRTGGRVAVAADQIKKKIEERLVRRAEQDGRGIQVSLNGSRLVLQGTVSSSAEARDAEDAAWNTPGVIEVENRLEIAA